MYIMFDTNVFVKDFHLKSIEFERLLNNLDKFGIAIFLNKFVIEETVMKYREKLIEYNLKTKNYQYLAPEYCKKIEDDEIEKLVMNYRTFITREAWKNVRHNVKLAGNNFEDVHYKVLFERCLYKRKPFSQDGRGLKDTLIWASLKETAKTYLRIGQNFIFITDNYTDFCDEKPSECGWYYLHTDLFNELLQDEEFHELDIKRDTIRIYRSISSFNNGILNEKSELFIQIINELNNERYRELLDYITIELEDVIALENNEENRVKKKELIGLNNANPREVYKTWTDSFDNLAVIIDLKYTISNKSDSSNEISVVEDEILLYVSSKDHRFTGLSIGI